MIKKCFKSLILGLALLLLVALPVLAIGNPDAIRFYAVGATPVYRVFYNVAETGDWLIVAEQYVYYAVPPTDYTARESFLFQLLGVGANGTIAMMPLNDYGAKPISIYLTAAQVTSANLTVGDPYAVRITGNPVVFASSVNNTVTAFLGVSDYVDQNLGDDGGEPTNNLLRNFLLDIADDLEAYDSPPVGGEYVARVSGVRYLTTAGADIFLEGIPNVDVVCPILFQNYSEPMTGDEPQSTGAYVSTLSPLAKWGSTSANGLTNLGVYLGINQALAGSVVLFVLVAGLAFYVYSRTQSGISVLLLMGATPFLGAWLGLMPMALAFIFTIILVVLMGFFFFSRGAL